MVNVVCQTCGDIGFEEALLYCDSCKIEAIHRYCVGITPTPFTEYVTWICEDCDASDCGCDNIEVDQTANGHALVEDHGVQDDTNVEPVEVSSSSVTETMKESKRRESSDSGKAHDLTGLVRDGSSVLEAGDSSSLPDHNSGTSKRSDSGFDGKEVDQTDKLRHMSKKKKKKRDKEKNSKNSSNHTPPVVAVQDHGVQDATSVEPMKVSSSPIEETTKESKKRERSDSRKSHELTGLARNGASVSGVEKSSTVLDDSSCTGKRNDNGSDCKEVEQTANLSHTLKKSEKKKKKKKDKEKNSKNSSSHTPPVLAVEDQGLQDATSVEPVKVSSSPFEETTKESKKRERSDSGKPHELTGLARNGASVSGVEKSSTVLDDGSCTGKRNDSGSDCKEVEQTDKLRHMSKKKKKKTDKEKNSKKSSNHSPPVFAVEDHGLQDATSVEPVKVSASPIKETTKESKKRERSDSGKPHELTGLARNGASVSGVEKSSTVLDDSSCTGKRNDCGSDCKEVDQTDKLSHILKKKSEKKKKKKKSSNQSPQVLAVEDHGVQEATNVEPVEVSSSPVKETMESKRQESSDRRKPCELTGLVQNGASVSKAQTSSSAPDHSSSTSRKRKLSSANIPLTSENKRLAGGNSSCKEAEPNMPRMSERLTSRHCRAVPITIPIWRGLMSVKGLKNCSMDGIGAHVSSLACPRVHETAISLRGRLSAEMLPRLEIWPTAFLKNGGPKDESVALFFFPSSKSKDEKVFDSLVLEMKKNDYAMRCVLDDAELLLFTSYMLPMGYWTFNSKDYLWGVFKPRKNSRH